MPRICLIEHDPDFAACLRSLLETEGFDVDWSDTVQKALPGIISLQPSVTVVDLHDGTLVKTDDIRQLTDASADVPVLVTANYKTPELACKALGAGARDYLLKPFSTREILERIHFLAGTGKGPAAAGDRLDTIADSIRFVTTVDDILRIALDQLAGTLHMADCLVALREEDSFRIMASKGYEPDPSTRVIHLSSEALNRLSAACNDPLAITTDIVREIISDLGVRGHRPFPTLMPLATRAPGHRASDLIGFVMGHGALVLEENDILEMEQFLAQIATEIGALKTAGRFAAVRKTFDREGQILIPKIPRDEAIRRIVDYTQPYLAHESDSFWIRLVLDEAINNAIIHGHLEKLEKPITNLTLRYAIGPRRVVFTVEDKGAGFDHRSIPDPTADENLLSINGRGIFIMRSVMDEVIFNNKGNSVSLAKNLDGGPFGPAGSCPSEHRLLHKNNT